MFFLLLQIKEVLHHLKKFWMFSDEKLRHNNVLLLGTFDLLGKPHPKKRVFLGIAQIAIWPPLLHKSGHFVAQILCRKWENSWNSIFDFGSEYFDSD